MRNFSSVANVSDRMTISLDSFLFTPQRGALWQNFYGRGLIKTKSYYYLFFTHIKMGKKRHSEGSTESNTPVKKEKVPEFNGTAFKAMLKEPSTAMKGECICRDFHTSLPYVTLSYTTYPLIHLSFIQICAVSIWTPSFLPAVPAVLSSSALIHSYSLSPAGLETFISIAKKLPCSDLYDVVEGYIKISMECAEIFKLLEREKHVESEVSWLSQWMGLTDHRFFTKYSSNQICLLSRWCWSLRAWRRSFWGQLVTCPTSTWLAMLLWKRLFQATWNFCRDLSIQKITGWCPQAKDLKY